jgi:Rrf2 family protein
MKLTLSVGYGIGVLLQIQAAAENGPVTAARIARGCRFPPRFLYRVLRRLVDAGLLRGTSGPGGGYSLAKRPDQITVLDIARGVESMPEASVLEPACATQRKAIARVNQLCRDNAQRFADELGRISLADLEKMDGGGGSSRPKSRPK